MKIVHVLPSLARGGGERLTIELANRQVEAGHEVSLVVGSRLPTDLIHGGLDRRVPVNYITADRGRARYRSMLPWIWRRRSWLASHDVLHCHLTYGALFSTAFRRLARRLQRPAIVETYHAVGMPIHSWLSWLHRRLATQWDGLALMVDDPDWREFADRRERLVFRIIPVGVDDLPNVTRAQASAYREKLGIPSDSLVVTTIGRLVQERRPRSYVPVFARIAKTIDQDVHFVMGGDGPERVPIEADASAAGIRDHLQLPGTIREIELPLAISDLYVTANVGPVPGVAGLQAIAAGVPTIAIQLSTDYLSRPDDWIWSASDPERIASKALELLRDPAEAEDLAVRQRAHLDANHSAAAMAAAYEEFYRDAIAGMRSA